MNCVAQICSTETNKLKKHLHISLKFTPHYQVKQYDCKKIDAISLQLLFPIRHNLVLGQNNHKTPTTELQLTHNTDIAIHLPSQ